MAGHPSISKTLELITREFWWLNMKKDVENYIKGCHTCQTVKLDCRPKAVPLQPNEIPSEPWEIISVDLIGPLMPSKGKDMILVIVDQFSKKAYFLPTNTMITSQGVANLYKEHIFKEHGLPKKVISDRGPQFVSGFMKGLYTQLGITANPSTAYHPQTDGQTEHFHGLFKVLEAVGKLAYKLELPPTWTIHHTFHKSKLKPAHEPVFPKQKETQLRPLPNIIDREGEHKVETIQKVRKKQGKCEFLIKWKGLPQEEASWEPKEHMGNTKEAIKDFYRRNPTATHRTIPLPSLPPSPPPSSSPQSLPITPASTLPLYTPHPRLYGWDDKAFHEEYLQKLERNWQSWKSAHAEAYASD
ncbi:hypothetical protein AX14_001485 [Amanita brunnescens Koide BX004]|nr:hypothetical protein AX14_001485 [Amanita brunnescens Koide BX004]